MAINQITCLHQSKGPSFPSIRAHSDVIPAWSQAGSVGAGSLLSVSLHPRLLHSAPPVWQTKLDCKNWNMKKKKIKLIKRKKKN